MHNNDLVVMGLGQREGDSVAVASASGDNKALIRRYIDLVWNQDCPAALQHLVGNGFVGHYPATRLQVRGISELSQLIASYHSAFSDLHVTIDEQLAEDNRIATRWTFHGTHDGALGAIPPTGRRVTVTGLSLHQVEADRLCSEWTIFDALAIGGQIWAPAAN
jgi:steroid delta-isomerase-like uncharacterized protein